VKRSASPPPCRPVLPVRAGSLMWVKYSGQINLSSECAITEGQVVRILFIHPHDLADSGFERKSHALGQVNDWGPQSKRGVDFHFDVERKRARPDKVDQVLTRT
jgi:hypothetical protein